MQCRMKFQAEEERSMGNCCPRLDAAGDRQEEVAVLQVTMLRRFGDERRGATSRHRETDCGVAPRYWPRGRGAYN